MEGKKAIFITYVNEIIIIGDDDAEMDALRKAITFKFHAEELGNKIFFRK